MRLLLISILCLMPANSEIVDSVIATVAGEVVKQSDVQREIRLTALVNGVPLDFSTKTRKEAVDRLIDQAVIRQEIEVGKYEVADPRQEEALVQQVRASHGGPEGLKTALRNYGLGEDELKRYLQWQAAVLKFVELRFGTGEGAEVSPNDQFFSWLDQMRKTERVEIHQERL